MVSDVPFHDFGGEAWQLWQELQPQVAFAEIPAAGHMVPMERPLKVAKQILNFLHGSK